MSDQSYRTSDWPGEMIVEPGEGVMFRHGKAYITVDNGCAVYRMDGNKGSLLSSTYTPVREEGPTDEDVGLTE